MGKPQVTLTFAGDESKLTKAFDNVGASARKMDTDVGSASRSIAESSEGGFDRAGEAADGAEGRAQGFSDTLTGTKDLMSATGEIAKGNYFEGFVMAGQGAADLAGGLASFVIPAIKNLSTAMIGNALQTARSTAANAAHKVASLAGAAATNIMAAAQRGLNLAMRANPIGIVITVLALLVAGIVIAYKRSETFRNVVQAVGRAIVASFQWIVQKGGELVSWFSKLPGRVSGLLASVGSYVSAPFRNGFTTITTAGQSVAAWFQKLPGRIGGFFRGVGSTISAPFRAAFSAIRTAWNNTVGGKGFDVPGWVPGVGGNSFRIPYFHSGGIVQGGLGSETMAVLKAGERVTAGSHSDGGTTLVIKGDGTALGNLLVEVLRKAVRVEGGNVQTVLGS